MKSITQVVENLIKPYIDSHDRAAEAIIATVETDATSASDDYVIGKQLILNNVLYDVIAPITAGDALVVNTNIKAADNVSSDIQIKQPKTLDTPITVGGVQQTTVEGALGSINTAKQPKTLDTPITVGGVQQTTVEGALGSINQTLTNEIDKAYQTDDAAITEVASDDLLPIYDTSAAAKKKIAVNNLISGLVSNPNILDNPWFTVNQRGQTTYTPDSAKYYTVDRWVLENAQGLGTLTVNNDGTITVSNTGNSTFNFSLYAPLSEFKVATGEVYTATIDVTAVTGDIRMYSIIQNSSPFKYTGRLDFNTTGIHSVTGEVPSDFTTGITSFRPITFEISAGDSLTLRAIKLEKGSVSTLAMDTAPNYAEELLKCQRYFQRYDFTGLAALGSGHVYGSYGMVSKYLPVAMRVDPTLTVNGGLSNCRLHCNGQSKVVTGISKGATVTVGNVITLIVNTAADLGLNSYICSATLNPETDSTLSLDLSADL